VIVRVLALCTAFLLSTHSAGLLNASRAEPPDAALSGQRREWAPPSESPTRILSGTVVNGDVDARTLQAAIDALPRRPERIVVVETKALPPPQESRLRDLDGFVLSDSRVIYLRRQGPTLLAAEHSGGPYVLMLAAIIWHEMAHAEGLDERQAQQREEDLWKEFMQRRLVDRSLGLTYLVELGRRR
jgi:hypothetical protein